MTAEQIKEKWDRISVTARNYGSWIHHNIERYLNELVSVIDISRLRISFPARVDIILLYL